MDHVFECPICLNTFENTVSLPCGHLYCQTCLTRHINAPDEELTCYCPDCRTPFDIVMPDLTLLPKKYHPFIMPAVRRVYLHIPNINFAEFQEKLEQAEQRLAEKTTECENLRADAARLAGKNLAYYRKNEELSVEKADLMNVILDLEIELYNTTEGRQTNEETVIQDLKDQINILGLELQQTEEQLRVNGIRMAEQNELRAEIADLERKLKIAQERIDADDMEANGMSITIDDLELDSQLRRDDNERLKEYNRELRAIIKEIGRKKELAEENLQKIASIALVRPQQAGSSLRKRTLATPPPMASGSHFPTKPLPKRRRIKIESL